VASMSEFDTDVDSSARYRMLDVKVRRCGSYFRWQVCGSDSRVIEGGR